MNGPTAETYWQHNLKYIPTGCQTVSKQPSRYVEGIYPKILTTGKGQKVWDPDGNSYIDLIAGLGAISVGYCNYDINNAIGLQLVKGISFSLPTSIEGLAAKKLTELVPFTEQWKFGKNGVDGVNMAVRCAKAYTGRDKIMSWGYHGCTDLFESVGTRKAGMFDLSQHITKAEFNKIETFKDLESKEYAAVILEPMVFDYPEAGFYPALRALCDKTGTVLIIDEVVTGGRFPSFTASTYFEIKPDLIVLSKGIANGLPLSAVGGKRLIMETFARDDFFASTTFGGECVSLAAMLATVPLLARKVGQTVLYGNKIKNRFNLMFDSMHAVCKGFPTRLTFDFESSRDKAVFMQEMCKEGVLIGYSNMVMADMTEANLDLVLKAITNVSKRFKRVRLEGSLPAEPLRMRK